jgi:hypothetical protein
MSSPVISETYNVEFEPPIVTKGLAIEIARVVNGKKVLLSTVKVSDDKSMVGATINIHTLPKD